MALRDPVAVYNADTNVEAHLVRTFLVDAGLEAFVIEDASVVGVCAFGTLPEIHKPQVFVERRQAVQARELIEAYGRREPRPDAEAAASLCQESGDAAEPDAEDAAVEVGTLERFRRLKILVALLYLAPALAAVASIVAALLWWLFEFSR